jgi:hypothetical protein
MDKAQKRNLILVFFLSPVIGLINLFKLKNERDITFFGTLFFGLLGSAFVYKEGTDGYSHLVNAKRYYLDMSVVEFLSKCLKILMFSATDGATDIYLHVISFLSASILHIPELVHVFAGFILGYFFTKSVLLVFKNNLNCNKTYTLLGFIALFLVIRSLGAMNSIRMWTGMWVIFYGIYSYSQTKEKKYIFVILFSAFVHFSYALIIILAIAAYILQRWRKVLVLFYILSFFSTVGFSYFQAYIPNFDILESKQSIYAIDSDEKVKRFAENSIAYQDKLANSNFYKEFGQSVYLNHSIVALSFILFFFYFKESVDANFVFLISVGIVIYAFSNVVSFAPELQGRSKIIAATFILAAAIHLQLTLKNYGLTRKSLIKLNIVFIFFLISAIPMFLFQLSYIISAFSLFIFIFPQESWLLGDGDYSIRNVLGLIID